MKVERVEIVNYRAFGDKVKAWAKGDDPLPKTMAEFAQQLADADVGAKIPARLKAVTFVQGDEETLVVRLPPKAMVEASEKRLAESSGSYPLPALYERVFRTKPSIEDMLAFHAERIGDYTIVNCA